MKQLLEFVLAQGAQGRSTIGSVLRSWLIVVGIVAVPLGFLLLAEAWQLHGLGMIMLIPNKVAVAIAAGILLSIVVMPVLAIIHIARKW